MKVLNLGAGNEIKEAADNHDISRHRPEIDLVFDLNNIPYPIPDNSYDKIFMVSVIEHLIPNYIETANEIWRIIRPRGLWIVKYPLHTSPTIADDPTHRWHKSEFALDYLDPTTKYGQKYGFYTPYKWLIQSKKIFKAKTVWMQLIPKGK